MNIIKKKLSVQLINIYIKYISLVILLAVLFLNPSSLFAQTTTDSIEQNKRDYPIIPFNTNFWNYWDHYWTTWLDGHPKYEAIELTAFDNPENPDYKLIRVFLSEKSGAKRQYFYLNDSLAVKRSRANTYYSDITFKKIGDKNKPKGLYVEFKDKDNELIQWTVNFDKDQKLNKHNKGLTPSIHSVGYVLLYHLRLKTQSTSNDKIIINGLDYAYKQSSSLKEAKQSWYNDVVYSSVLIFGKLNFGVNDKGELLNSWGRTFSPTEKNKNIYRSNLLGPENYIEFEVDENKQMKTYKQMSFGHAFRFNFRPSLPSSTSAKNGQVINYSVSFDNNKDLMTGKVIVEKKDGQLIYNWSHNDPEWARNRPFQSILTFNEKGYKLTTLEVTD